MKKNERPWLKYYDGVRPNLEYPDKSIYKIIRDNAQDHLDYCSYNYFGKKVTYREFLKQIDDCARAFLELGVKKGDRVSICMPNTPEGIISFYAISKIGAIANMIHPLSSESELKYYFNVSECNYVVAVDIAFNKINHIYKETRIKKCIIVSPGNSMPLVMKLGYKATKGRKVSLEQSDISISWNDFIKLGKNNKSESVYVETKPDDVAVILYTGGTTGNPKGIQLTNRGFSASSIQCIEACQCLDKGDSILAIMPIFHGFGLGVSIHTVQMFGGCSILIPQFDVKSFDKLLLKYKPNIIAGVPTLYEALLKNKNLDGKDLSFLKFIISGGDSLPPSLKYRVDNFLEKHNSKCKVREGYGLTETVSACCLQPLKEYREDSIGIPYPDMIFKIVKPGTFKERKFGEEGEIIISGPSVTCGYLNDSKETKYLLKEKDGVRWLFTGDMGYMDEDGFVFFKQRIKRMIVSSGYNIYPQYIENVINSHPDVHMSCVIGVPHPYKQMVAKAFIVLKDNNKQSPEELEYIKRHCEQQLVKYSWPYEYEFRDSLPKTLVGKVAYKKLVEEEERKNEQ